MNISQLAQNSREAFTIASCLTTEEKNKILNLLAQKLRANKAKIIEYNKVDIEVAKQKGLSSPMIKRLELDDKKIESMAAGVEMIARLEDPVGKVLTETNRKENGLNLKKISCPIGVIVVIYESRPNVTIDAAALCLKSGNATILRGGSESFNSSKYLTELVAEAISEITGNTHAEYIVQYLPSTSRDDLKELLQLDNLIDLVIPRGGKGLIEFVSNNSKIPVLKHLDGNCHIYVEKSANQAMALKVIENAKFRNVAICGALESLLIDREIAQDFIPKIVELAKKNNCILKGCNDSIIADNANYITQASEEDYYAEFLDYTLSIKVVYNIDEAISHINKYGSHHTDSIMTTNTEAAKEFTQKVDSAIVMHNTSTQFADGGEFGMGAEIGISTGRLHARGPVGLNELNTYKYIVSSDYSVR